MNNTINCERCNNKSICKFKEYADETNSAVLGIKILQYSPFSINVKCSKFSEQQTGVGYFNNSISGLTRTDNPIT